MLLNETALCFMFRVRAESPDPLEGEARRTQRLPAIVVLMDTPENILRRIVFYDIESRPVEKPQK